jgi:3-phenylpropionate/trans-cinnamate dioxygenase ferredoxin subunit
MSGDWVRVGKSKSFASDGAFGVKVGNVDICLVRLGGKFFALDNRCTHAEAQLSAGELEDGELACPLHGARFDVKTGDALTPPAVRPVQTHEVKLDGDDVLIRLNGAPTAS